jgi:folylpolyglutamate synthase/dihydropteroate synthase
MPAAELSKRFKKPCRACGDVQAALTEARTLAGEDGLVICAGSVYLAGDVVNIIERD